MPAVGISVRDEDRAAHCDPVLTALLDDAFARLEPGSWAPPGDLPAGRYSYEPAARATPS